MKTRLFGMNFTLDEINGRLEIQKNVQKKLVNLTKLIKHWEKI